MHLIILSSVASPTLPNFSHYLINGTIFRGKGGGGEKITELAMYVLIFSTTFVRKISDFKKTSARYCTIINMYTFSVMYLLFLWGYNENFSADFVTIRPMGAESFYVGWTGQIDRQADTNYEANSRCSELCEGA
jgi:hypothetical protein